MNRSQITIIAFLLGGGLLLGGYHFARQQSEQSDPRLLDELHGAKLAAAGAPGGNDWPQWRGPDRDGVARETGFITSWPETGPKVLWQAATGGGYSSVAVAGGRVFTLFQSGDAEVIVSWNADTGQELWRHSYPSKYAGEYGPGPRSTPTVDGDRVYTVGGAGMLHCLSASDGKVLWKHDLLAEFDAPLPKWGVACSPLVEGELVIVLPGGHSGGSVAAFRKQTGELAWKCLDDPVGYSSPVAATFAGQRQLLAFTGHRLVGVSPEGQPLWQFPWNTAHNCNIATPIVRGDYVYISSGYGKGCAVLKITGEGDSWDARQVYKHNRMCNHFSSSVLHEDHVYGFNEFTLTCMEFRTGKIVWKDDGVGKGSVLLADGNLLILNDAGRLFLAPATPVGFRPTAQHQFSARRCWSAPALANGKLYLRDELKLICYEWKDWP